LISKAGNLKLLIVGLIAGALPLFQQLHLEVDFVSSKVSQSWIDIEVMKL